MAGLFVWMKQGRVCAPGGVSSQAADSVAPGVAEVDGVIPEVRLNIACSNCKWYLMWSSFYELNFIQRLWWRQELWREELWRQELR